MNLSACVCVCMDSLFTICSNNNNKRWTPPPPTLSFPSKMLSLFSISSVIYNWQCLTKVFSSILYLQVYLFMFQEEKKFQIKERNCPFYTILKNNCCFMNKLWDESLFSNGWTCMNLQLCIHHLDWVTTGLNRCLIVHATILLVKFNEE